MAGIAISMIKENVFQKPRLLKSQQANISINTVSSSGIAPVSVPSMEGLYIQYAISNIGIVITPKYFLIRVTPIFIYLSRSRQ